MLHDNKCKYLTGNVAGRKSHCKQRLVSISNVSKPTIKAISRSGN